MKKLLFVLTLMVTSFSMMAQVEHTKDQIKSAEKVAKSAVKELKKEGWIFAGVGTFESAYAEYLLQDKRYGGLYRTDQGNFDNASGLWEGEEGLLTAKQSKYAQEQKALLDKDVAAHLGSKRVHNADIHFETDYLFNGDVRLDFYCYKKLANGRYDLKGFFIIDENASDVTRKKVVVEIDQEISRKIKENAKGDE